jgi:hypothetical protein
MRRGRPDVHEDERGGEDRTCVKEGGRKQPKIEIN